MKLLILCLCIAAVAAQRKKCRSNDECEEGQCCVNYALIATFGGYCNDLRKEGESCTPLSKIDESEPPKMYHFICPCQTGMNCEASHEIEVFGHVVRHRPECIKPDGDDGGDGGEIGEPDAE